MTKAVCTCNNRRVHFSDFESMDLNRQCVSCPADFRASQERVKLSDHDTSPHFGSAVSTCCLTEQALLERSRSRETVDVKEKCQEWLNRWLASNNKTQHEETLNEDVWSTTHRLVFAQKIIISWHLKFLEWYHCFRYSNFDWVVFSFHNLYLSK